MIIEKMNLEHLDLFCKGLNALPESVRHNDVVKYNRRLYANSTTGIHTGLIILADVPQIKEIYAPIHLDYSDWSLALAKFLGFYNEYGLEKWAYLNPHLWTMPDDFNRIKYIAVPMFTRCISFNQDNGVFQHQVIIDKWNDVNRLCKREQEIAK